MTCVNVKSDTLRICFTKLTMDHLEQVQLFVAKHYAPREPSMSALNVPMDERISAVKTRTECYLREYSGIGAFDSCTGSLIGVNFCKIKVKSTDDGLIKTDNAIAQLGTKFPWCATRTRLFEQLGDRDIFSLIDAKRVGINVMLAVDADCCNMGLGAAIIKESDNMAREDGCDFTVASTISQYSQKLFLRQGYKVLRFLDLKEYVDATTGLKPYKVTPPHHNFSLLYKPL